MEKVLFVEIHSLDNERGCFAGNEYLARFFAVSARQIRTYIGSLKEKGFISVTIRNRNERVIRTTGRYRRISNEEINDLKRQQIELAKKFKI